MSLPDKTSPTADSISDGPFNLPRDPTCYPDSARLYKITTATMMKRVRDVPRCPMRIPLTAELQQTRIAADLVLVGLVLSATGGLLSPNGVVQFDDLTHYLYAKWAWRWPAYLLDNWGRPGFTVIYFLPAGWGWPACRFLSAMFCLCFFNTFCTPSTHIHSPFAILIAVRLQLSRSPLSRNSIKTVPI